MEQRAPQATPLPIESIAMRQYQSVGITFGRMGIMCVRIAMHPYLYPTPVRHWDFMRTKFGAPRCAPTNL
jgi:hypothetical protein